MDCLGKHKASVHVRFALVQIFALFQEALVRFR